MSAFIRVRTSQGAGVRWQVLYRMGGRSTPIRSAGTFASADEAARVRDIVSLEIAGCALPTNARVDDPLVYIAELGSLLKIGISIDPARRCRDLHARLLHTEPGGLKRERELHRRFAHLRRDGEFFSPGSRGEIRRYIKLAQRQKEAA